MNAPEAPAKKKISPWVWAGCGCGAIVVAGIAFVAFLVVVVFAAMRSATPYQEALARARSDARVIEALGSPIEPGWWMAGKIQTSTDSGSCDITVPISGPKQSARLRVVGIKSDDRWTYSMMRVIPNNGPPIDLLAR